MVCLLNIQHDNMLYFITVQVYSRLFFCIIRSLLSGSSICRSKADFLTLPSYHAFIKKFVNKACSADNVTFTISGRNWGNIPHSVKDYTERLTTLLHVFIPAALIPSLPLAMIQQRKVCI